MAQALAAGDAEQAADAARRLLLLDPLSEAAYRTLMQVHADQAQTAQALKLYDSLRERLHRELGVQPEPATAALYDRIRQRRPAAIARPSGHHLPEDAPPAAAKPSIAVLPFVNLSGDPEQQYFSDGITEDIITELSRFRTLFVIARNSSFRYRGGATRRHAHRPRARRALPGRGQRAPHRRPRADQRPADRGGDRQSSVGRPLRPRCRRHPGGAGRDRPRHRHHARLPGRGRRARAGPAPEPGGAVGLRPRPAQRGASCSASPRTTTPRPGGWRRRRSNSIRRARSRTRSSAGPTAWTTSSAGSRTARRRSTPPSPWRSAPCCSTKPTAARAGCSATSTSTAASMTRRAPTCARPSPSIPTMSRRAGSTAFYLIAVGETEAALEQFDIAKRHNPFEFNWVIVVPRHRAVHGAALRRGDRHPEAGAQSHQRGALLAGGELCRGRPPARGARDAGGIPGGRGARDGALSPAAGSSRWEPYLHRAHRVPRSGRIRPPVRRAPRGRAALADAPAPANAEAPVRARDGPVSVSDRPPTCRIRQCHVIEKQGRFFNAWGCFAELRFPGRRARCFT